MAGKDSQVEVGDTLEKEVDNFKVGDSLKLHSYLVFSHYYLDIQIELDKNSRQWG